jgi:hypothetical protein
MEDPSDILLLGILWQLTVIGILLWLIKGKMK